MKYLLILLCFGWVSTQADTLKDPTQPSTNRSMFNIVQDAKTLTTTTLKLTAIINNKQNKQAIINGESFAQGQQVQGYKLILISENHVVLDGTNGKQTLFVNSNNIKKDVNNGF
jgi:MSHA biogenesis protein MshK